MKKKVLLVLLLLPMIITQAQTKEEIFSKKSNWIEVRTNIFDTTLFELTHYKIEGDTLINGENYAKLFRNDEFYSGLRETEANRIRVFFPFIDRELLIYDFDWYPGKTLYFEHPEIEDSLVQTVLGNTIDSVQLLDGKYYQCVKSGSGEVGLIKGIGDTDGFFAQITPWPTDGSQFALLCFFIDDTLVYSNPDFNYCETISITETAHDSGIKIYPNPTTGELKMENGKWKMEDVTIYDAFGRFIVNCPLSIDNSIDISHLPAGIYFLKVNETTTKIIKL